MELEELSVEMLQEEEKEDDIGNASLFMEEVESKLASSEQMSSSLDAEIVSNLVQFLKTGAGKHILVGVIKEILEELTKPNPNLENIRQILEASAQFCTFRRDTSHWTAFCTALTKDIIELGKLCKPMNYDPYMREKFSEWKTEFEKLLVLEKKESFARDELTKLRQERDKMIIEMYGTDAVSVRTDGSVSQNILHHEKMIGQVILQFKEAECERKEAYERCEQIRHWFVSFDSKLMREIRAQDLLICVCAASKDLLLKLNEPNKNEEGV